MADYLVVAAWTAQNYIAGFAKAKSPAAADALVVTMKAEGHAGAFRVPYPATGGVHNWIVDGAAKTVTPGADNPVNAGPTNDQIYDQVMQNQRVFKAYAQAVNDGSVVPGGNMSNAALKAAVKAKM